VLHVQPRYEHQVSGRRNSVPKGEEGLLFRPGWKSRRKKLLERGEYQRGEKGKGGKATRDGSLNDLEKKTL